MPARSLRAARKPFILRPDSGVALRLGRPSYGEPQPVTLSKVIRRAACVTLAAAATALPITISAQVPTPSELSRISPAGNYLAAREAGTQRDSAAAAAYYRAALKSDPRTPTTNP